MSSSVINVKRIHVSSIGYPVQLLESTAKDIFYILTRVRYTNGILATKNMSSVVGYKVNGGTLSLFDNTNLICEIKLTGTTISVSGSVSGSYPNLTKILHEIAILYILQKPT